MVGDRGRRPGAESPRLFVAIEVPAPVKEAVRAAFAPWRERFPRARWVPPENQHVTLKFLGSTPPRLVDRVTERLREVAAVHAPVSVRVRGVGAFPSPGRARVLWAGLDDGDARVAELAPALDLALAGEFEREHRAFHPHLTVARSDPPLALPGAFEGTVLESEPFEVDHLVLFRSHLRRPAPRYEVLASVPLGQS